MTSQVPGDTLTVTASDKQIPWTDKQTSWTAQFKQLIADQLTLICGAVSFMLQTMTRLQLSRYPNTPTHITGTKVMTAYAPPWTGNPRIPDVVITIQVCYAST